MYTVYSNIVKIGYSKICVVKFMEGLVIHILNLKLKDVTTKVMKKTSLQLRGNSVGPCIKIFWYNQLHQSGVKSQCFGELLFFAGLLWWVTKITSKFETFVPYS
jgi:hypothetical protein